MTVIEDDEKPICKVAVGLCGYYGINCPLEAENCTCEVATMKKWEKMEDWWTGISKRA